MDERTGEMTKHGYLALPPSGAGPGLLVLHAWWGPNAFIQSLCERLSRMGFVALAPDLYRGRIATSIPEAEALSQALDGATARDTLLGALDALRRNPDVQGRGLGVLGCSLGGWWALQLAALRPEDIAAVVLFYGVGDADFTAARAAYLAHFAEHDAFDSLDEARAMVDRMRAAGRDVVAHEYPGVGHWFFESDRSDAYAPDAALLAWNRTLSFLDAHLDPDTRP